MLHKSSDIPGIELFHLFSEIANDDVYILLTDQLTGITRWSTNAVEEFGVEEYSDESKAEIAWPSLVHPNYRALLTNELTKLVSGQTDSYQLEYPVKNKAGKYVWIQCTAKALSTGDGNRRYIGGIVVRTDSASHFDPVTQLVNLTYNPVRSQKVLDSIDRASILMIGIDDFRTVCAKYGYTTGNEVLHELANIFQEECDKHEQGYAVYRFLRDEFVFVLNQASQQQCEAFFNSIKEKIKKITINGTEIHIDITGSAVKVPSDGRDYHELISKSGYALEYAKKYRRKGIVFYTDAIASEHRQLLELNTLLKRSITNQFEGFEIYYQPIVDARRYAMTACEALLRFKPKGNTSFRTDQVISMLEQTQDIMVVGRWIIDTIFKQIEKWQKKYGYFTVGINVSVVQLNDQEFVPYILKKAREYHINPRGVVFELTESVKATKIDVLKREFKKLQDFGFMVALDDFGTGFSTLNLLRDLEVESVKIDQTFIMQLEQDNYRNATIVENTIELCNKLHVGVVVEGVENQAVLKILENYDILTIQGYHFAKPMPLEEFETHIFKSYK